MYSTEQKILWLCIAIFILSFISAKILYTQFGKESLLKMPSSYHYKNSRCAESNPNRFGECGTRRKLCIGTNKCIPNDCVCPVVCTRTKAGFNGTCPYGTGICRDLKTCAPKECKC